MRLRRKKGEELLARVHLLQRQLQLPAISPIFETFSEHCLTQLYCSGHKQGCRVPQIF